jgi:hypothetical protein
MRRGVRSTFCVILAACSSPGPAVKPPDNATTPKVSLSYGWQPGLEAQVDVKWSCSMRTERGETHVLLDSSYLLTTAAEGDNLLVQSSNIRSTPESGNSTRGAQPRDFVAGLSILEPDLRVTADGKSAQINDVRAVRARTEALTTQIFGEVLPLGWRTSLETTFLSDRALNAFASDFWGGLVGSWLDAKLEIGRTYTGQHLVDNLLFPDKHLSMDYEYTAMRIVPCRRGPREVRCIELRKRATSGPADTDRAVSEFERDKQAGNLRSGQTFSGMTTEYGTVLVTEPESLIPHAYTYTTVVQGVIKVDGESQPIRREDRVEYSFRY